MKFLIVCKEAPTQLIGTRLFKIAKFLRIFHEVALICQKSESTLALTQAGIKVYVRESNYEYLANLSEKEFDVIIFQDWYLAKVYFGFVKRYYEKSKIVIDAANLEFVRNEQMITLNSKYVKSLSSGEVIQKKDEEIEIYSLADVCWVSSPDEKDVLRKYIPLLNVEVIPSIYNYKALFKESCIRHTAYFISNGTSADIDAGCWFVNEVFDLIEKEIPQFMVTFIGNFDDEFKEKNKRDRIVYKTFREIEYDIDYCLKKHEMCLMPTRFNSGIDERLVQAILNDTPVITTSVIAKSLNLSNNDDAIICDTPLEFVEGIKGLHKSITIGAKGKFSEIANLAVIHENVYKHLS